MQDTIHAELIQLSAKFTETRQSGNRRCFPDELWREAVAIADKFSITEICQAIQTPPAYFRKKISMFSPVNTKEPLTFLEIPRNPSPVSQLTISIESNCGHRLKIDGMPSSCIAPIISQFLKEGTSCCR